ncbi:hypothetical protein VNO77_14607 [Canavalia gladiata]|uniref:Uncharacterized protein n=1 Tax=Canavalia gladiata TaxID=3824 RepID=A0AAN9QQV3_CANGL
MAALERGGREKNQKGSNCILLSESLYWWFWSFLDFLAAQSSYALVDVEASEVHYARLGLTDTTRKASPRIFEALFRLVLGLVQLKKSATEPSIMINWSRTSISLKIVTVYLVIFQAYLLKGHALSALGKTTDPRYTYKKAEETHLNSLGVGSSFLEAGVHLIQLYQDLSKPYKSPGTSKSEDTKSMGTYPSLSCTHTLLHAMGDYKTIRRGISEFKVNVKKGTGPPGRRRRHGGSFGNLSYGEDIESIKTHSKKLEMQSVNDRSLIEELDQLLGQGLEVPSLDPTHAKMRAVREKRGGLQIIKPTFYLEIQVVGLKVSQVLLKMENSIHANVVEVPKITAATVSK